MNASTDCEIDESFRVYRQLDDGTEVVVRTLRRSDQELLSRGFERLSDRSRYQRFLAIKPSLSPHEIDYLVDVDNEDHLAIGAGIEHDGDEEGVGVARFVRYADTPHLAEAAVAVIDEYQGRGVGRLLLEYLASAARERGISAFHADTFASNTPMRRLFEKIGDTEVIERAGAVVTLEIDLTEPGEAGTSYAPYEGRPSP